MEGLLQEWTGIMDHLRGAPAWVVASALTFLPLLGVPAVPLFVATGARFGTGLGCAVVGPLLGANMALAYALAQGFLRPLLGRWLVRRGVRVPAVPPEDRTSVVLLFRVTPGIPLCVQNYALGMADVGFGRYMAISLPVQWLYGMGFIVLGDSMQSSSLFRGLAAVGLVVAGGVGARLIHRHLRRRGMVAGNAGTTETRNER